jgi:hypothetical protein
MTPRPSSSKRSHNLQVLVTPTEAERIRELAWSSRTSVSQFLRWLVTSYLEQQKPGDTASDMK